MFCSAPIGFIRPRGFESGQEFHRPGCAMAHTFVYAPEGVCITHVIVTYNREIQRGHPRGRWFLGDCEFIHGEEPALRKYPSIRPSVWSNDCYGDGYENRDKPACTPTEDNSEYRKPPVPRKAVLQVACKIRTVLRNVFDGADEVYYVIADFLVEWYELPQRRSSG